MAANIDDVLLHICDSLEPLELADRLNISAENLIDELEITTEQLVEVFKERISRNLRLFRDVYEEGEDGGC